MAKTRVVRVSSTSILQLAIGFFFVVLGILGIIPQAGEGFFSFSRDRTTLEIIFGIAELFCGGFFLFDAVRRIPRKTSLLITLIILCLWIVRIIITLFYQGIDITNQGILFHPTFWGWLQALSVDLVIAAVLWYLYKSE